MIPEWTSLLLDKIDCFNVQSLSFIFSILCNLHLIVVTQTRVFYLVCTPEFPRAAGSGVKVSHITMLPLVIYTSMKFYFLVIDDNSV